jgi:hypothetical protein
MNTNLSFRLNHRAKGKSKMARTKGVNKSQAVRDYLGANPKSKAKDVVAALADTGLSVTEGLVYAVKGGMKEKRKRKARLVKAAKAATPSRNGVVVKSDAISMIREVKAIALKAGGYQKLKDLVDALAE